MGRIGRSYPRFDLADRDAEAAHDPRVPSLLTSDDDHHFVRDIAMTVIWVLGVLVVLAWALGLYR